MYTCIYVCIHIYIVRLYFQQFLLEGLEDSYQTIFSDYLSPAASAMLGFTARNPHKFDAFFNLEIREFLFSAGGALAEDLIALNIHRGRDHGMSGKRKIKEK